MQHAEDAIRAVLERAVGLSPDAPDALRRHESRSGEASERPAQAGAGARGDAESSVPQGVAPGAAAVAGTTAQRTGTVVAGLRKRGGGVVTPDTLFDLASLTKVVATLPCVLSLVADGEIELEDPVRRFFSNAGWFQQPSLGDVPLRALLGHTSGLPAWTPLFARAGARRTAVASALQTELVNTPGTAVVYSDLGFIVLGAVVERVTGMGLDAYARERLFAPLGMTRCGFRPLERMQEGTASGTAAFAATEDCGWRGELLDGVVHDENAWTMDGVAGHAGLFGTAEDVARYAQAWLRLVHDSEASAAALPFPRSLALEAVREHAAVPAARRGLGWALAWPGSAAGTRAGPSSFGHTGFTGTSLWIDPDADWFAVLLTNRVHPSRERGKQIGQLRHAFHDRVALAVARGSKDAAAGTGRGTGTARGSGGAR